MVQVKPLECKKQVSRKDAGYRGSSLKWTVHGIFSTSNKNRQTNHSNRKLISRPTSGLPRFDKVGHTLLAARFDDYAPHRAVVGSEAALGAARQTDMHGAHSHEEIRTRIPTGRMEPDKGP